MMTPPPTHTQPFFQPCVLHKRVFICQSWSLHSLTRPQSSHSLDIANYTGLMTPTQLVAIQSLICTPCSCFVFLLCVYRSVISFVETQYQEKNDNAGICIVDFLLSSHISVLMLGLTSCVPTFNCPISCVASDSCCLTISLVVFLACG